MNEQITRKVTQIPLKCIKRDLTSYKLREMKIKATMGHQSFLATILA